MERGIILVRFIFVADFEVFEGIFSATKRKVILIKLVHDLIMINDVGGKGRREILIEGRLFFAATKEEKSPY